MSKDFIGFRVTPDVKERLEAEAEKEMRPLSHLIRDRVLRAVPSDAKIAVDPRKAAELVKDYESLPTVDLPPEPPEQDRESWIGSTARILMMEKPGLSKHAARIQATGDWEAAND